MQVVWLVEGGIRIWIGYELDIRILAWNKGNASCSFVIYVIFCLQHMLFMWLIYFIGVLLIEDYQKLTPKEENDLNTILSQVEDALTNVEIFTDQLSSELQELEYVSQLKQWLALQINGLVYIW